MSFALVLALCGATVVGSCALGSIGLPGSRCCCSTHRASAPNDSVQASRHGCCDDTHVCGARQPALEVSHFETRSLAPSLVPAMFVAALPHAPVPATLATPFAATGPPFSDLPTRTIVLLI